MWFKGLWKTDLCSWPLCQYEVIEQSLSIVESFLTVTLTSHTHTFRRHTWVQPYAGFTFIKYLIQHIFLFGSLTHFSCFGFVTCSHTNVDFLNLRWRARRFSSKAADCRPFKCHNTQDVTHINRETQHCLFPTFENIDIFWSICGKNVVGCGFLDVRVHFACTFFFLKGFKSSQGCYLEKKNGIFF